MQRINLWGNLVELDENATRRWYGSAIPWGCDCGHCRNFLTLAKEKRLPGIILETLDILGILPENATYVCEIYPEENGHCYQFSYRLSGNILEESAETKQSWGEVRCCHEPYPYGAPGFPEPHFDLEFWVTLPWVLPAEQNR